MFILLSGRLFFCFQHTFHFCWLHIAMWNVICNFLWIFAYVFFICLFFITRPKKRPTILAWLLNKFAIRAHKNRNIINVWKWFPCGLGAHAKKRVISLMVEIVFFLLTCHLKRDKLSQLMVFGASFCVLFCTKLMRTPAHTQTESHAGPLKPAATLTFSFD